MGTREKVTSKVFLLKDKVLALKHKEETGGLLFRVSHPLYGGLYEVRYIPEPEPWQNIYRKILEDRVKCLKSWPIYIHYYTGLARFK